MGKWNRNSSSKKYIESVSYPVHGDYKDNSSEILKEILNTKEVNSSSENSDIEKIIL